MTMKCKFCQDYTTLEKYAAHLFEHYEEAAEEQEEAGLRKQRLFDEYKKAKEYELTTP